MGYIGKSAEESVFDNRTVDTMTGDGSDTTLALSTTPISVNNVLITIDGVMQRPTNEYTLSGSTITFTTAPANGAVVTAITGGGEHIGTPLDQLEGHQFADNAVTDAKITTGITASKLTGTKGAWNASALTGMDGGVTKGSADPTVSTTTTAGDVFLNKVSGELYVCTDATANANVWTNVGLGTGDLAAAPANPTNTGSFPASNGESSSYNFTFSGATDYEGNNVTHYLVDTISNAALTVASAEVAAGSAHTFNTGAVGSDVSGITFRVRAKDSLGTYSTGVTITTAVTNVIYTTATGGTITTVGDYKVHTFTSSSSFNVSQIGNTDATVEYLVIAGGGGGTQYGAGGAGGYRTASGHTVSVQNYTITVGAGGNGAGGVGQASDGTNSVFSSITSTAGGGGAANTTGRAGGSGGGGGDGTNAGGAGTSGQGHAGGKGWIGSGTAGGGGGGASAAGGDGGASASHQAGGAGSASSITGSSVTRGGGGGGRLNNGGTTVYPGGAGGGGNGVHNSTGATPNASVNTGGGAGARTGANGGQGGSGVVIVRYKFQN